MDLQLRDAPTYSVGFGDDEELSDCVLFKHISVAIFQDCCKLANIAAWRSLPSNRLSRVGMYLKELWNNKTRLNADLETREIV